MKCSGRRQPYRPPRNMELYGSTPINKNAMLPSLGFVSTSEYEQVYRLI